MERLSEAFARLARRVTHPDKKITVPMQHLEQVFRLNDPAYIQNPYFQTMVDFSLGINDMNRPRLQKATDDIDVAFGFYGIHDPRDGNVMVKKILMLDPRSDKTIRPHLREDTVARALEFAGLCVEQLFQKKTMDLNGNMHMAITLQGDELTPRWKAGQKGQSPQP